MKSIKILLSNIISFFPVQLLLVHFKRNQLLLSFWILMFLIVFGVFGREIGVPFLFYAPEYMHEVWYLSYFIFGFSIGSFIMAYQVSCYIINGYLFPFLALETHPFGKYALNNFVIPLLFIVVFCVKSVQFQLYDELLTPFICLINIAAFLFGIVVMISLSFVWFFSVEYDIFRLAGFTKEKLDESKQKGLLKFFISKDTKWKIKNSPKIDNLNWRVTSYLQTPFCIKFAKKTNKIKPKTIQKVLRKNHISATLYSWIVLVFVIIMGIFKDIPEFMIPAAASFVLILTILILISSAIYLIFKEWTFIFIIIVLFGINYISKFSIFEYHNSAYGLSYKHVNKSKSVYLSNFGNDTLGFTNMINILEKRKKKLTDGKLNKKPVFVFINSSGGGLRAAVWAYTAIHIADSVSNEKLLESTQLITGASGGMLGAAYLRELYLMKKQHKIKQWFNDSLSSNLAKDFLNPIVFTLVTGDWIVRIQQFEYNKKKYFKDRAYIFEKTLNEITGNILEKNIVSYTKPEKDALIPLMIFSPAAVNNGERFLISSQDVSMLEKEMKMGMSDEKSHKTVYDFRKTFREYQSDSLRFTSAIRMNATFPYISPYVNLPGNDNFKIIDAALDDNFGISTSFDYISVFSDWLIENSSAIVCVQILNQPKINFDFQNSFFNDLYRPFQGAIENFFTFQKMRFENQYSMFDDRLKKKMHFVNLELFTGNDEISLSWHLTKREKLLIKRAIYLPENQKELEKLKRIFEQYN